MTEPMNYRYGYNLQVCAERAEYLPQVRKADLRPGDRVFVKTRNSLYVIRMASPTSFMISGGWFDKKGLSPMQTTITGCSWGGSMIKLDVVAALGLCLEFGNRLVTTPIQKIVIVPQVCMN